MATFAKNTYSGAKYAAFRPTYEQNFFKCLAKWAPNTNLAVDVGCGTGAASGDLAKFVAKKVIGLEPSKSMIDVAIKSHKQDNLEFKQGSDLELTKLFEPNSVDLVTAAQSAHWFKYPEFFESVATILKPQGKLAIWGYADPHIKEYPQFNEMLLKHTYGKDALGPYWDEGRSVLTNLYKDLEFPNSLSVDLYDPLKGNAKDYEEHPLHITRTQTVGELIAYLHTYSSYHNWKNDHPDDVDIVDKFSESLRELGIKEDEKLTLCWDTALYLVHKR